MSQARRRGSCRDGVSTRGGKEYHLSSHIRGTEWPVWMEPEEQSPGVVGGEVRGPGGADR